MIKAKWAARNLMGMAAVGIALAGLGGSGTVGPAPAFSQDRETQCVGVLEPALKDTEAALEQGNTMDEPGVDYAGLCTAMKGHEAKLEEHRRNLAVCEGLNLGGQDQVTLEGLLQEVKLSREAITQAREAICEAADLRG